LWSCSDVWNGWNLRPILKRRGVQGCTIYRSGSFPHDILNYDKQVLQGVCGEKPSDIRKLAECIQKISQLVTDFPQIKKLDLNPTVVFEEDKRCKVIDVRIGLS
ncbi:MAG: acetate--CoA ligase family protein, partial [Candidatus Nitrosopolaris sp.]